MKENQYLHQIIQELSPEFVNSISSQRDVSVLYELKKQEVSPDKRELIQGRIDYLYRKAFNES